MSPACLDAQPSARIPLIGLYVTPSSPLSGPEHRQSVGAYLIRPRCLPPATLFLWRQIRAPYVGCGPCGRPGSGNRVERPTAKRRPYCEDAPWATFDTFVTGPPATLPDPQHGSKHLGRPQGDAPTNIGASCAYPAPSPSEIRMPELRPDVMDTTRVRLTRAYLRSRLPNTVPLICPYVVRNTPIRSGVWRTP